MKKKILFLPLIIITALVAAITCSLFAACGTATSPNEAAYWFSENSYEYVNYDSESGNSDTAGAYWHFTAAKDEDITMSLRMTLPAYATAYLYVNDVQVQSENNTGIYTFVYKLSLKKGDKIKLHAFRVLGSSLAEGGFEITYMTVSDGQKEYPIKEFDKSTSTPYA
ncbi:MAG: hypothetical protein ACI4QN_01965 [Candidatus Coproplasma sp.]